MDEAIWRAAEIRFRVINALEKFRCHIEEVVSGLAQGPDLWGRGWAIDRRIPVAEFPAEWVKPDGSRDFGAGFRRNYQMAKHCDAVFAFWDGESKGTEHMIKAGRELGKKVQTFRLSSDWPDREWFRRNRQLFLHEPTGDYIETFSPDSATECLNTNSGNEFELVTLFPYHEKIFLGR